MYVQCELWGEIYVNVKKTKKKKCVRERKQESSKKSYSHKNIKTANKKTTKVMDMMKHPDIWFVMLCCCCCCKMCIGTVYSI